MIASDKRPFIYNRDTTECRLPMQSVIAQSDVPCLVLDDINDNRYKARQVSVVHDVDLFNAVFNDQALVPFVAKKGILIFASSDFIDKNPKTFRGTFQSDGISFHYYVFGIRRRVHNGQYLTPFEWKQLLEWANANSSKNTIEELERDAPAFIHSLLWPPDSRRHVIALAVLCQGYLVSYATHYGNKPLDSDVQAALALMGWDAYIRENLTIPESHVDENLTLVSKPEWWWKVFSDEIALSDSARESALAVVTQNVELALKTVPIEVIALLGMIRGNSMDKPTIVAKAYCALMEKLESTS